MPPPINNWKLATLPPPVCQTKGCGAEHPDYEPTTGFCNRCGKTSK